MLPDLTGLRVVVTRPVDQAPPIIRALRDAGAEVMCYPALRIQPPPDREPLQRCLADLAACHVAIFVSTNAVAAVLDELVDVARWPATLQCAAIGKRTAQRLLDAGLRPTIVPDSPYDSETLLTDPRLQHLDGQRVIIFRGTTGRDLMATTLRERGAEVMYVPCYQRSGPDWDVSEFIHRCMATPIVPTPILAPPIADPNPLILFTSGESLDYFRAHLGLENWNLIADCTFVAGGSRVAALLQADANLRGEIITAADPTDGAMLAAVQSYVLGRT